MLHTNFRGNQPVGSGGFLKSFYHIWDLGHVTSIMSSDFHFFVPENFHKLDLMFMKHYAPYRCLYTKVGQIKNWSGEYRDIIPTKLQCQAIQRALQSPNLQREIIPKK